MVPLLEVVPFLFELIIKYIINSYIIDKLRHCFTLYKTGLKT